MYYFSQLELYFCVAIFIAILSILTISVFSRYVVSKPILWGDETVKYCFMWLIFISAAYTAKREEHITIDAFQGLFPQNLRKYAQLLGRIIWIVFCAYLTYFSAIYTAGVFKAGASGIALGWLNLGYVYLAIPVGYGLIVIHLISHMAQWKTEFKTADMFIDTTDGIVEISEIKDGGGMS